MYGKTNPTVFYCEECNFQGYTARTNKTMAKVAIKKYCGGKCCSQRMFNPKTSRHSN